MLVTCHWPHCEEAEQNMATSKNTLQTPYSNTQNKSTHHQSYYPHYFEATTVSQKIQDIT